MGRPGRFRRFVVEYVGNLDLPHPENDVPQRSSAERRTNRHGRELIDWIKGQMEARDFPAAKTQVFVQDLREALRQGEPAWDRVSVGDSTREGARDAPS